jgi:hypothetical protein
MRAQAVRNAEAQLRHREGTVIDVLFSGAPLLTCDGAAAGFVCVAQDMTERVRLERELKRAKAEAQKRQPGQEQLPGEHEPRDPHADELRHRYGGMALATARDGEQREYLEAVKVSS